MTKVELGIIIKSIRKEILNISQKELAEILKVHQSSISGLEAGSGGSLDTLLELMNYLEKKHNMKTHLIFKEPFDSTELVGSSTTNIQQALALIDTYKAETIGNADKLKLLLNTL